MVLGAILGIGSSILGAAGSASAASKQEAAAKKQAKLQYKYDKEKYKMNKERLEADRDFSIEGIDIAKRNEANVKNLKDTQSLQNYEQTLQIRQNQLRSYEKQFAKSQSLFNQQNTFNEHAARTAMIGEQQRMNDAMASAAFQNQDLLVQALQEQGQVRARGQSGNSLGRNAGAVMSARGRNQAVLAANLVSTRSSVRTALRGVATKKFGSDIQAFANLMIPAEESPMPFAPMETPVTEYQYPRELEDFDFGPEPIKGVVATGGASAAWMQGLAGALPQVAGLFQNSGPPMSYGGGGFGGGFSGGSSFNIGAPSITGNSIGSFGGGTGFF